MYNYKSKHQQVIYKQFLLHHSSSNTKTKTNYWMREKQRCAELTTHLFKAYTRSRIFMYKKQWLNWSIYYFPHVEVYESNEGAEVVLVWRCFYVLFFFSISSFPFKLPRIQFQSIQMLWKCVFFFEYLSIANIKSELI